MTPVWWYRKRFFFIVASLSTCLRLFCSSVTWGRYLGKFHSYSHSFSDILFPFPFLSNNAVSWLPGSFQAAPHLLRNTTPLHIINLSKNHLFPIALDRKKKKMPHRNWNTANMRKLAQIWLYCKAQWWTKFSKCFWFMDKGSKPSDVLRVIFPGPGQ